MLSWVKHHFQHLRKWRDYAELVARAVSDLVPEAEVYVIGSVVEGKVTVYSDIDVLVVIPNKTLNSESRKDLVVEILERAIEYYGLPWDAPIEIHVADKNTLQDYLKHSRKPAREVTWIRIN